MCRKAVPENSQLIIISKPGGLRVLSAVAALSREPHVRGSGETPALGLQPQQQGEAKPAKPGHTQQREGRGSSAPRQVASNTPCLVTREFGWHRGAELLSHNQTSLFWASEKSLFG